MIDHEPADGVRMTDTEHVGVDGTTSSPSASPDVTDASEQPPAPVRIGSTSAYQFAAQVVALGVNFIVSVLVARTLGPEGKGQLSVLQQVPGVLMVLLNFGLAYSNFYFVGRRKQPAGEALGNSILVALAAGIVGAPIVWLLTIGPLAVVPNLPASGAIVAAVLLPISLVASFAVSVGNGLGLLKKASLANMIATGLTLLLVLAAYALDALNVTAVLAISAVTGVTSMGFVIAAMRPLLGRLSVRMAAFRESAKYSVKSYLGNLAGYLNYRLDIILVGYLAGAASVGVYSIAVTFAELMWYVPNALATSIQAKTMSVDKDDAVAIAARTSRLTSALMLLVCVVAAALIMPIISVFYGAAFMPAVVPFLLLLPGVWTMGVAKIMSGYLAGHGKLYPGVAAVSALLNLIANIALIPLMGSAGAALASSVSYSVLGGWFFIAFPRFTGIPARAMLFPTAEDIRALKQSAQEYAAAISRWCR